MDNKMNPHNLLKESFIFCLRKYGVLPTMRTRLRRMFLRLRWLYLARLWKMDIHPDTMISLKANLDKTYPSGIHIGQGTAVSFDAVVLSHDLLRGMHRHTHIGKYCAISARSIIMPGLTIGDHCVIGAGTVVTKDVPAHSLVVGNPGRIIRTGIMTGYWGKMTDKGQPVEKKP